MDSVILLFLFSTPLVYFRMARIWLFVVVPVSLERCRHLQNRIFIFYCKTQGEQKWPLRFVETICDFIFSFFHPSQPFFVLFFCRGGLRFFSLRLQPLSSLFRYCFLFFRPLSPIFLFYNSKVTSKCSPVCLAKKMFLSIIKPMVSSIVFFGRSGTLF